MRGFLAAVMIVGLTLTGFSVVAPRVIADENGEVHYWTTSSTYVPQDEAVNVEPADQEMAARMMAGGTHVYLVNDDPGYDLSGPNDHWFLVGDGTAFRDDSWRGTAVFARAGGMPHEIIPISAEYRQDWLAVAAGDRAVRTFNAPRAQMNNGVTEMSSMASTETPNHDEDQVASYRTTDTFRPVQQPRRRAYHPTKRARYSTASHYRTHAEPSYTTASVQAEPAVAATEVAVARDETGHEIFQMGTSWYMKDGDDWFRSESWRGPFVLVKKGFVPREVRMSADHPSRMDND